MILITALIVFTRSHIADHALRLARRPAWCMLVLGILPVALRLLLLARYPIPSPAVSDDFSYILAADTLRHFRLANPAHPLPQFFETFFVLQQPSYSSIFPLGQAFAIAGGWIVFGHPWAGVALSIGVFCALCYWMLRGWTTPGWALLGGLLAVMEFGPLSQWMNSFWGGAVSGIAGCLVFGALPRIAAVPRTRDVWLLGAGLGLQILTRPFESLFLLISVVVFGSLFAHRTRILLPALAPIAAALAITLLHNRAVTGEWTKLPYQLSREQYGVPTTLTFQALPVPQRTLTREQQLDYEAQSIVHGPGPENVASYAKRWLRRVRFYRFFLLPPLYLALLFVLPLLSGFRVAWVAGTILLFSLGTNFYPYFYTHYIAAIACLLLLLAVFGLESMCRLGPAGSRAARFLLILCGAHFLFWYGIHLAAPPSIVRALDRFETWDAINHGDPEGRLAVSEALRRAPGRQLVFVRYGPAHEFEEWVHNGAEFGEARVIWARDLGQESNLKLRAIFPARVAWLLEPDAKPPRLTALPK